MFQIGDKVVHPMYGAGVVDSIVQKTVDDVARDYYILKLPNRSMVVMVPTENCEEIGVRPVVDQEQANQVLAAISGIQVEMKRGLSTGERKMLHSAKQILISEIVLSKSVSYESAEEELNTALA